MSANEANEAIISNYFDPVSKHTFVEAGTGDGLLCDLGAVLYARGWRSINVEPDPVAFRAISNRRPNGVNVEAAMSSIDAGAVEFVVSTWPGNSSLAYNPIHREELESYSAEFQTVEVRTVTWDSLMREVGPVDFAIIDTEGHELDVIAGMSEGLPPVMSLEFGYSDRDNTMLDKGAKTNHSGIFAIARALAPHGYVFDFVAGNNAYFSLDSFWEGRQRPETWVRASSRFVWRGYELYSSEIDVALRMV